MIDRDRGLWPLVIGTDRVEGICSWIAILFKVILFSV